MGDLNFRNHCDYSKMIQKIIEYGKEKDDFVKTKIIETLLMEDELEKIKKKKNEFGFSEMKINFLPTYKFKCK